MKQARTANGRFAPKSAQPRNRGKFAAKVDPLVKALASWLRSQIIPSML